MIAQVSPARINSGFNMEFKPLNKSPEPIAKALAGGIPAVPTFPILPQTDGVVKVYTTKIPEKGVGTELAILTKSLGLGLCGSCKDLLVEMNIIGVRGCEKHFDRLVKALEENRALITWLQARKAEALAIMTGLVFKLDDPRKPIPSLLRHAIKLAKEKGIE